MEAREVSRFQRLRRDTLGLKAWKNAQVKLSLSFRNKITSSSIQSSTLNGATLRIQAVFQGGLHTLHDDESLDASSRRNLCKYYSTDEFSREFRLAIYLRRRRD